MAPDVIAYYALLTRAAPIVNGITLWKFVFVYLSFVFNLCLDWFCRFDFRKGLNMFWNVHLLMIEFDCPGVTLCSWQGIQIQLLTDQG